MGVVDGAVRRVGQTVGRAADATTSAAGAVGGAAVNGIVGGVTGAAAGVQRGIGRGSHSTPAAALTFGALGLAGLVEWPVLLAVGGGALLLRQLSHQRNGAAAPVKSAPTKAKRPVQSGPQHSPSDSHTAARQARGTRSRSRR